MHPGAITPLCVFILPTLASVCAQPGCKELSIHQGRCATHQRKRTGNVPNHRSLYDRAWDRLRALKLAANPLCERCEKEGRTRVAIQVHHILKVRQHPDLRLQFKNLMSVCIPCHVELDRYAAAEEAMLTR